MWASAASAAASYDQFDDRYLGAKTSNPTLDNDGNALQVGAEYWNSVSNERRTWTGSAWVSSVTVVPDNSVTTSKLVDGSVTTAKLADGSVTTAKWAAANGQLAGFRNFIINGDMRISQRGTSFTSIANNSYLLDRWQFINTSSAVLSASQVQSWLSSTDPNQTAPEFQNALRLNVTTADTSIASGDVCGIRQIIEGNNLRSLITKPATLSFWVKSSKSGVHCVAFKNKDTSDRSYIVEYTITNANTWEYKIITIPVAVLNMEFTSAGTWDYDNGQGLSITWVLAAGSTFQTTANSWRTGNFLATSNQVNCLDSTSNSFVLTGVQLEPGSVATPFEHRPFGAELALCQRYYATIPAGAIAASAYLLSAAGNALYWTSQTPVPMRVSPTIDATTLTYSALNFAGNPSFSAVSNSCIFASVISVGTGNTQFSGIGGTLRLSAEL